MAAQFLTCRICATTVLACQEKAQYLLKFAGVSRIPLKKAGNSDDSLQSRPSWANKGKNWSKISAAVSTVGKLKQHVSYLGTGTSFSCLLLLLPLTISCKRPVRERR